MRWICARVEAVCEAAEEQRFDEAEDGLDDAADGHDAHVRRDAVDGAVSGAEVHNQRLNQVNRRYPSHVHARFLLLSVHYCC